MCGAPGHGVVRQGAGLGGVGRRQVGRHMACDRDMKYAVGGDTQTQVAFVTADLIHLAAVDQHQSGGLARIAGREKLHVPAAERMADQQVGWLYGRAGQQSAQFLDDHGTGARWQRGVAVAVARAVVTADRQAFGHERLQTRPDERAVAQPRVEHDRGFPGRGFRAAAVQKHAAVVEFDRAQPLDRAGGRAQHGATDQCAYRSGIQRAAARVDAIHPDPLPDAVHEIRKNGTASCVPTAFASRRSAQSGAVGLAEVFVRAHFL